MRNTDREIWKSDAGFIISAFLDFKPKKP